MASVLLTRPAAAAARFAAQLRARRPDLPIVIAPLMRIVPLDHDSAALRASPAVVLTSPEAVPFAGPGAGRTALCFGPATAGAARAAGFAVAVSPTGEAGGLLPMIAACPLPLVHPHGRHVAQALPVPGVAVYDQEAQPLTPEAKALLAPGAGDVLLPLFSPRSTRLAAAALGAARGRVRPLAISPAAAAAWTGGEGAPVPVAVRPDAVAMADLVLAALGPAGMERSPLQPG